jgi:hypothetical protein
MILLSGHMLQRNTAFPIFIFGTQSPGSRAACVSLAVALHQEAPLLRFDWLHCIEKRSQVLQPLLIPLMRRDVLLPQELRSETSITQDAVGRVPPERRRGSTPVAAHEIQNQLTPTAADAVHEPHANLRKRSLVNRSQHHPDA